MILIPVDPSLRLRSVKTGTGGGDQPITGRPECRRHLPHRLRQVLCYQLPALALPHLTLVISPLIALMHDQLAFLRSKGIAAATLDSSLTPEESRRVMQQASDGQLKILMISVERLRTNAFAVSSNRCRCRCWWWTRPTAFRSGATTFAPTISSCRITAVNCRSAGVAADGHRHSGGHGRHAGQIRDRG